MSLLLLFHVQVAAPLPPAGPVDESILLMAGEGGSGGGGFGRYSSFDVDTRESWRKLHERQATVARIQADDDELLELVGVFLEVL